MTAESPREPETAPRTAAGRHLVAQFDVGQFGRVLRLVLEVERESRRDAEAREAGLRDRIESALDWLDHGDIAAAEYALSDAAEYDRALSAAAPQAAPPAAPVRADDGLDPERLARAMWAALSDNGTLHIDADEGKELAAAQSIAAKYQRLPAPAPESGR